MTGVPLPSLWEIIVYIVKLPFRWLMEKIKGE